MEVKWVVAEEHSELAATLLGYDVLHAPSHWQAEAVNVIWSKGRFGMLAVSEAEERTDALQRAPVQSAPIAPLIRSALTISVENDVTIYDSLYLALARQLGIPFVTADMRLLRKVGDNGLRSLVQWIGTLPAA